VGEGAAEEAFSEKHRQARCAGRLRPALGREMIGWITHLQHTRAKDVFLRRHPRRKLDDFDRKVFVPQIDGAKTGLELPGIVDEAPTMTELTDAANQLAPSVRLPDA